MRCPETTNQGSAEPIFIGGLKGTSGTKLAPFKYIDKLCFLFAFSDKNYGIRWRRKNLNPDFKKTYDINKMLLLAWDFAKEGLLLVNSQASENPLPTLVLGSA